MIEGSPEPIRLPFDMAQGKPFDDAPYSADLSRHSLGARLSAKPREGGSWEGQAGQDCLR